MLLFLLHCSCTYYSFMTSKAFRSQFVQNQCTNLWRLWAEKSIFFEQNILEFVMAPNWAVLTKETIFILWYLFLAFSTFRRSHIFIIWVNTTCWSCILLYYIINYIAIDISSVCSKLAASPPIAINFFPLMIKAGDT